MMIIYLLTKCGHYINIWVFHIIVWCISHIHTVEEHEMYLSISKINATEFCGFIIGFISAQNPDLKTILWWTVILEEVV